MSSTAMRIKNSTDVATIKASINIGVEYGHTTVNQNQWGSINCEFVWYTLNIYNNSNSVLMTHKTGCYGSNSFEVTGSNGNYAIHKV